MHIEAVHKGDSVARLVLLLSQSHFSKINSYGSQKMPKELHITPSVQPHWLFASTVTDGITNVCSLEILSLFVWSFSKSEYSAMARSNVAVLMFVTYKKSSASISSTVANLLFLLTFFRTAVCTGELELSIRSLFEKNNSEKDYR